MSRDNRVNRATVAALYEIANCIDDVSPNEPRLETLRGAPLTRVLDVCENAAAYAVGIMTSPPDSEPRDHARRCVLSARGATIAALADADWKLMLAVVALLLERPDSWSDPPRVAAALA